MAHIQFVTESALESDFSCGAICGGGWREWIFLLSFRSGGGRRGETISFCCGSLGWRAGSQKEERGGGGRQVVGEIAASV